MGKYKQLTIHSSATEREIAEELTEIVSIQQFSCSTRQKLGNSWCLLRDKVCCMSHMGFGLQCVSI